LEEERTDASTVLFPITIDDAVWQTDQAWAALIRRSRHIGDFRKWADEGEYARALERLLNDLRVVPEDKVVNSAPSAGLTRGERVRLADDLDRHRNRYDTLTRRIRALEHDIGIELDGERRLVLQERLEALLLERSEVAVQMVEIEGQLNL